MSIRKPPTTSEVRRLSLFTEKSAFVASQGAPSTPRAFKCDGGNVDKWGVRHYQGCRGGGSEMTDEMNGHTAGTGDQPQPPAAPPTAPPPAYVAPVEVPVDPAQAAAPPKKKRTGLIIGLIIGFLAICGLAACATLMLSSVAANDDTELITTAETHYAAAQAAVDAATKSIENASGDQAQAAIDAAGKELRTGRDEIAASRVAIEQIEDSQGRTDYLGSLDAATEALDGLEDLLAYMSTTNDLTARMEEASDVASRAHEDLNDAITAGNVEKYSTMGKKATAARDGFGKAAEMFREAHELDTSAGLDKAAIYADKRKAQAVVVVRMADEGKDDKTSAYNKSIDKMNKLGKEADKIGEPDIISDSNWVENRLSVLNESVLAAAARADELHAKAVEELDFSG